MALTGDCLIVPDTVLDVQCKYRQAGEHFPDIWMVINADHRPALDVSHQAGHLDILLPFKRNAVALGLPVRRIHVKEGVGAIVAAQAFLPGEVLDVGAGEAQVGSGQALLDPAEVDHRRGGGRAEILAIDLAAKGVMLQVIEARCALDIGEGFRLGVLVPLEDLPAADRPLELPDKLFEVVLDNAIQVHQLAVDVVDDFGLSRDLPEEKQGRSATKDFDIAVVGREQREEPIGKTTLATEPGDDGYGHDEPFVSAVFLVGSARLARLGKPWPIRTGSYCVLRRPARCISTWSVAYFLFQQKPTRTITPGSICLMRPVSWP